MTSKESCITEDNRNEVEEEIEAKEKQSKEEIEELMHGITSEKNIDQIGQDKQHDDDGGGEREKVAQKGEDDDDKDEESTSNDFAKMKQVENSKISSCRRKIVLLENEIELSVPLAIGTLQWGTTLLDDKIINPNGGVISDTATQSIIDVVSEAGVTMYDTAEGYGGGTSEKRLGRLLSHRNKFHTNTNDSNETTTSKNDKNEKKLVSNNDRDENTIFMTKFLPVPWRFTFQHFENAVRASCKRLNVDCIDVYLMHSPVHPFRSISYWVEACSICHKKGIVKAMGLSNCNAHQVLEAVEAGNKYNIPIVCNQVHYSLLCYNSQNLRLMEKVCNQHNVKIVAFSPIGQGLLTDNLTTEKLSKIRTAKMLRLQYDDLAALREKIHVLSKQYDKTMAQIALNWCLCHNVIPLVGCRKLYQAKDIVGCLDFKLSTEEVKELDALALAKSTLDSKKIKRYFFVTLFGIVMVVCKILDEYLGYGMINV